MNVRRRRISLRPCCRRSRWSPSRRCSCPSWPRARPSRPPSSGRPAGKPFDGWPRRRRPGSPSAPTPADGGRSGPPPGGASSASGSTSSSGWPRHAAEPVDAAMALPLLIAGWLRQGLSVTVRGELVAPDADPGRLPRARRGAGRARADGPAGRRRRRRHPHREGPRLPRRARAARSTTPSPPHWPPPTPPRSPLSTRRWPPSLWAAGRAPWQVLAGATRDGTWEGELLHSTRPFGVGYHVAVWQADAADRRRRPDRGGQVRPRDGAGPRVRRRGRQRRRHAALPRPRRRHGQAHPRPSAPRCPTTCSTSST